MILQNTFYNFSIYEKQQVRKQTFENFRIANSDIQNQTFKMSKNTKFKKNKYNI